MEEHKAEGEKKGEEGDHGQGPDSSRPGLRETPRARSMSNVGVSPSPAHQSAVLEAREELAR